MADGRDAAPGWRRLHLEAGDVNLASGASTLEVMEGAHRYNRWIYDRVREGLGQRVLEIGHPRRSTKAELRRKLEASGFTVERIRRSNPVGALGWLVNVRLLGLRRLRGAGLFDRLVPALRIVDRLELPLGLSLIAIARKPAAG